MLGATARAVRLRGSTSVARTSSQKQLAPAARQISMTANSKKPEGAASPRGREAPSAAATRRARLLEKHLSSSSQSGPSSHPYNPSIDTNVRGVMADSVVAASSKMGLRIMTLNRPDKLNTLNAEMIELMEPLLEGWESSPTCSVVLIKANGRAFCAGGDVASLVKAAQAPETRQTAIDFFTKEYTVDRFVAHMKKPVVAFLDGITMGGGVGLSVHAPFRIATEKTVFSMPETNIGLFPDVGANFFLPRLDGQIGAYLGLTSERLKGYSVYLAGIATHFVPSDRLSALEERLAALTFPPEAPSTSEAGLQLINACIEEFVGDADAAADGLKGYPLTGAKRAAIDTCFKYNRAEEIVGALEQLEKGVKESNPELAEWAKETRETIEKRSPTSVKVALRGIRLGKEMGINEVFDLDMQLATAFCNPDVAPDFVAGVTHLLIKKGKTKEGETPFAWSPSTLSDVSSSFIESTFFDKPSSSSPRLPQLSSSENFKEYPHAGFALPSEKMVERVVKGSDPSSGSFAMTQREVVDWFEREWGHKVGVRAKVEEVLSRKCETNRDGVAQWR